jgi:hypothetical protein
LLSDKSQGLLYSLQSFLAPQQRQGNINRR